MNRRYFLKTGGISLAGFGVMGLAPNVWRQFAQAATLADDKKRKTLITIFQRGAMDGLNAVVPYGDSNYYDLRRTIAIAKPGQPDGALKLNQTFGLHPALAPFEKLYQSGQLAVIHAVGSPDNTRSHFDAQDYMESATPGVKSTPDGWLNRVLQAGNSKESSPFQAVAMTAQMPRSLYGRAPSVAMTNLNDFAIRAGNYTPNVQGGFEAIYAESVGGDALGATGKETFEAIDLLKKNNPSQYKPENGAVYTGSQLGNSLRQIAQLIKAGVGLEIAFAEANGWDTHANQGGARGQFSNLLRDFSQNISALTADLGKKMDDVVILTMSEFGRTARENGTRGTDHGHANAMFVIGNGVKGGRVYGDFPGLANDKLNEGRDLAITTDFRDVFAEIADKHLDNRDFARMFPGYKVSLSNRRNFLS